MTRKHTFLLLTAISLLTGCIEETSPGYSAGVVPPPNNRAAQKHPKPLDCSEPGPACPCDEQGARQSCGKAYSKVGEQLSCGPGEMVCDGEIWGECMVNFTIQGDAVAASLGGTSACNNACSPNCHTFNDDPSGLTDPGTGLVATPGGLSLPAKAEPQQGGACDGGSTGSCEHSICVEGGPLSAGCDATAAAAPSCVSDICATNPSCCSGNWDSSCVALIDTVCDASCYADPYD
ncbi:MAG TPA: hypothetical protein ENK23_03545, partial [Sorangium sp.]|nr:hypothetical protein [Sorangium sp.]